MNDLDFVRRDLRENGMVGAWDWNADLRFAVHMNADDDAAFIREAMRSNAPTPIVIDMYKAMTRRVRSKRLRALQTLVRNGEVKASWIPGGHGSVAYFGVNRFRVYELNKEKT
jgi:hypothetical protein